MFPVKQSQERTGHPEGSAFQNPIVAIVLLAVAVFGGLVVLEIYQAYRIASTRTRYDQTHAGQRTVAEVIRPHLIAGRSPRSPALEPLASHPHFRGMHSSAWRRANHPPVLDPFTGEPFYVRLEGAAFLILSPGPDGDYDVGPATKPDPTLAYPPDELVLLRYDPTNGTISSGDILRWETPALWTAP